MQAPGNPAEESSTIGALTPTPVVALIEKAFIQSETESNTQKLEMTTPPDSIQGEKATPEKDTNLDPIEFTFPEAEKETVTLWRPPLYPVPWEPTPQDHFFFTRPIGANDRNWPLSIYRYGYLLYTEPHTGIDIPSPVGTPIMAAGPGTVMHAGYGVYTPNTPLKDPYGIAVLIKHDFGYQGQVLYTLYGHMRETYVFPGQRVETGDVIGVVGETGKTSGPHLHLEIRVGDHRFSFTRNPELWIAPPQGWGVLVGQVMEPGGRKIPGAKLKLVNQVTHKTYEAISYAVSLSIRPDEYYNENLVLGDIPAGDYLLYLDINGSLIKTEIEMKAGQITFFSYQSKKGFEFARPQPKGANFKPPENSEIDDLILPAFSP